MGRIRTPGEFCWLDIQTSDVNATKWFYGELFGCQYREELIYDRTYTTIHIGQDERGGLSNLNLLLFPAGTPPHVSLYVAVTDVDRLAARVPRWVGLFCCHHSMS